MFKDVSEAVLGTPFVTIVVFPLGDHYLFIRKEILFSKCHRCFIPRSANPTKWSNTLKQFVGRLPANCLSVFDHFFGIGKGLKRAI